MTRKRRSRMYVRKQGGEDRFYGDFRDFGDVGGRREALIPRGKAQATSDEKLAVLLIAQRLAELEGFRRRRQRGEPQHDVFLRSYALYHLAMKASSGNTTPQWVEAATKHLDAAVAFFCEHNTERPALIRNANGVLDRELTDIRAVDVQAYVGWLVTRSNRRGAGLSSSTQRKYLNSLSNLYRRAASEQRVPLGYNPVASLVDKPQERGSYAESQWLEVHQAALLLESARTYEPHRCYAAQRPGTLYAIIATMLLTGGRPGEILGLEVRDVSFERETVTFRPNSMRTRLKNCGSVRSVRLWPQLSEVLRAFLDMGDSHEGERPLFPSSRNSGRVIDIRKGLDVIAGRVGWAMGSVRPYAFRHTYCAARLQTLDNGAPVSPYTVAKELGHNGMSLVDRVYGHLGQVRHRSPFLEYRIQQHQNRLHGQLKALGASDLSLQGKL